MRPPPALEGGNRGAPGRAWADVYDPLRIRILTLSLDPGDWARVVGDGTFSIVVPAMFGEAGEPPLRVSIRRKSATALGQKVSLKIDINEYVQGQTWRDLRKLSLENGDDQDVVAEGFAWLLHRLAALQVNGTWVPQPSGTYLPGLAAWCALLVNGQYLGTYVNVEQPDKRFMQHRGMWTPDQTWLYKVSDLGQATVEEGAGESPTYQTLCYTPFENRHPCPPPSPAVIESQLTALVNMRALLHHAAVSTFHAGSDQLFSKGKNFWFVDRLGGAPRHYLPWDLDSVFQGNTVNTSIYGQGTGPNPQQTVYQRTILNNATFRAQYHATLDQLIGGMLDPNPLVAVLDYFERATPLPLALQLDPNNNLSGSVADRFNSLRAWVVQRAASIAAQTP